MTPALSMRARFAGLGTLWAVLGVICIIAVGFGLRELSRQRQAASDWVDHALEVLARAASLDAHLERTIGEGRGFVLSRGPLDRAHADEAAGQVSLDIAALRALTRGNAVQQEALDRLDKLVAERIASLREMMQRTASDTPIPTPEARVQANEARMDAIHSALAALGTEEQTALTERRDAVAFLGRLTADGLVGGGIIAAMSLTLAASLAVGRGRERRYRAELERVNRGLDARVRARTAALAESEARQRGYFDNAPVGLFFMRIRADGEIVHEDVNPAFVAIYGIAREALIGRTLREVWPEAVARDITDRARACVVGGRNSEHTVTRELRGSLRTIDVILVPIRDAAGRTEKVLGCARDMTTQRELERQIVAHAAREAEAAELERTVFRNIPDSLFIFRVTRRDDDEVFVYETSSPASELLTGVPRDDIIGRTPEQVLPPITAAPANARLRQCLAEGRTISFATAGVITAAGRFDLESSVTPVRDPATGLIHRMVAVVRDVTERNRMEAALRHSHKMEALGRVVAGVAHDFNNLLQAISGSVELVLDELPQGAPPRDFARTALDAARLGANITAPLLAYARHQVLWPRAVETATFLAGLRKLLAGMLGPHIGILVRVDPATPPVFADPGQLQTALLNLAINAGHAMAGGGTLSLVAAPSRDANGAWVSLAVADSGTGMDETTLGQATDPFFTTKGAEGNGLGLSMVKGFAEQSGGELRITSRLGAGTSVELRLPSAPAAGVMSALPDLPWTSGRVLLVDDTRDVLRATKAGLTRAGFDVAHVSAAGEAIALLESGERFDALVTDFAMPGMTGAALVQRCRLLQPGLPALIITGLADSDLAAAPADVPTVRKPFESVRLIQMLHRVMARAPEPATTGARR